MHIHKVVLSLLANLQCNGHAGPNETKELFGQSCKIFGDSAITICNRPKALGISAEFMSSFADALIANDDGASIVGLTERAKQFLQVPVSFADSFSAMYGRKLHGQLEDCLSQLQYDGRRAYISLNLPSDAIAFKEPLLSHLEYPCTACWQFFRRDGILHMHVHMRSQNLRLLCIDAYIAKRVQEWIASIVGIAPARYHTVTFGSLHYYEQDLQKLRSI